MIDPVLETQYNARAAVPDSGAIIARWAAQSERVRARFPFLHDLRYGPGEHERLDLFAAPHSRGVVLFLHGGYWRALYKEHFSYVAEPLLERGVSVAVASYDLCPTVSLRVIVEECRRATVWLARHASHHAAHGPLVVAGHSAGGHLCGMLLATDWARYGLNTNPIAGGVSISGLFDLRPLVHTTINDALRLTPEEATALSPVTRSPSTRAPFVLAVGELESAGFWQQSVNLRDAWQGNCREVLSLAGCHHFNAPDHLTNLTLPLFGQVTAQPE